MLAIAAALLTATAAYGAVFLVGRLRDGLPRSAVREYVRENRVCLQCAVIRQETALTASRRWMRSAAAEGTRLAAGEAAAIVYDDAGEYMRASLLLRLRRELQALECSCPAPLPRERLAQERRELSAALVRGDFDGAGARAQALSLGLLPERQSPGTAGALREEIRALEAAGAGEFLLTAPAGAVWSETSDGWEALSPGDPLALDADLLEAVFSAPVLSPGRSGRFVTDGVWLLAALMDSADAALFPPGDAVTLEAGDASFSGEVILLRTEGDRAVAVFRCRDGLEQVLDTRVLTVEIVTERTEGLLLPESALHFDDGGAYVCRIAGRVLRREAATLLELLPEGALVASDGLRPGDSVLLGDPADCSLPLF